MADFHTAGNERKAKADLRVADPERVAVARWIRLQRLFLYTFADQDNPIVE